MDLCTETVQSAEGNIKEIHILISESNTNNSFASFNFWRGKVLQYRVRQQKIHKGDKNLQALAITRSKLKGREILKDFNRAKRFFYSL